MWTEEKQRLLDSLREKEFAGILTSDEQQQLDLLFTEIDAEEEEMLRPAMERYDQRISKLEKERAALQAQNAERATLVARQEQLLTKARTYLNSLLSEQAVINSEYERISGKTSRVG
ncbi:MAG: hypothetical protein ABI977_11410 [Acidobacteriota bacterium]